jgi:hypothetical protein
MKQIGLAFRTWELDHNDKFPMQVSVTNGGTLELSAEGPTCVHFQVISNELSTPKLLKCPADKTRVWATNFTTDFSNQKISYFVGLDATPDNPASFLTGDRNITNALGIKGRIQTLTTNILVAWTEGIHEAQGNICLADGSVQGLSTHGLQAALVASGLPTNRLAMP